MADKYLVQEESLTSIADAIRAKAGTSDKLAFPAGFAEAIEAIQAGGGNIKMTHGDFTLSEGITLSSGDIKYEIEHGLGYVPSAFVLISNSLYPSQNDLILVLFVQYSGKSGQYYFARRGSSTSGSGDYDYRLRKNCSNNQNGAWIIDNQESNVFLDNVNAYISSFAYSEYKASKLNTSKYLWFAFSYDLTA